MPRSTTEARESHDNQGRRYHSIHEVDDGDAGGPEGGVHRRRLQGQEGGAVRSAGRLYPHLQCQAPAWVRAECRCHQGKGRGYHRLHRGERCLRDGRLGQGSGHRRQGHHAGGRFRRLCQGAGSGSGPERPRHGHAQPALRPGSAGRQGDPPGRGAAGRVRGEQGRSRSSRRCSRFLPTASWPVLLGHPRIADEVSEGRGCPGQARA